MPRFQSAKAALRIDRNDRRRRRCGRSRRRAGPSANDRVLLGLREARQQQRALNAASNQRRERIPTAFGVSEDRDGIYPPELGPSTRFRANSDALSRPPTPGVEPMADQVPHPTASVRRSGQGRRVRGAHRARRDHRAEGLDAGAVSQAAHPDDVAARAFRDRRHAARGQLDHPRAEPAPKDGAASPRCRTRRVTGSTSTAAPRRSASTARSSIEQLLDGTAKYSSIFNYPTLTWADIGVHRLVRRRRGDRQPDDAREGVVRSVRARDGPHLQGRELPQAPGLRDHGDARRRHAGAARDGAGRGESLVVAVAHDVRPARQRFAEQRRAACAGA